MPMTRGSITTSSAIHIYDGLKGKKVVFVPLAMGFDLTEGWAAIMRQQAADLGYTLRNSRSELEHRCRHPRAHRLIAEKPDLASSHNPDLQSYARLLKQRHGAGIKVLQVNLEIRRSDRLLCRRRLGAGRAASRPDALVKHCGAGSGKLGQGRHPRGQPTAASNLYELYAY